MVGILVSFWDGLFSKAMLVLGMAYLGHMLIVGIFAEQTARILSQGHSHVPLDTCTLRFYHSCKGEYTVRPMDPLVEW